VAPNIETPATASSTAEIGKLRCPVEIRVGISGSAARRSAATNAARSTTKSPASPRICHEPQV
jgi:hypothetical protein